jgi:hypothetical protein
MSTKQDNFLDIISELDETELNSLINNLDINSNLETLYEPSKESLERIKTTTYSKINQNTNDDILKVTSKTKRFFSPKIIAATAALLAILILPFSKNVIAEINRFFKYIPGNNQVIESRVNGDVFVLKKSVKVNTENGYLELTSLVIDNEKSTISILARGRESGIEDLTIPSVSLKLKNGQIIQIHGGGFAASDNREWSINLSTSDNKLKEPFDYKEGDIIDAVIEFENKFNVTVPAKLEKANSYEAYKEIGPTSVKNDLSITAVPMFYDDRLNVNLLYSSPIQNSMENYNPKYSLISSLYQPVTLTDKNNNRYKNFSVNNISDSITPFLYELNFDVTAKENNSYKLNIPYIKTTYSNKISHKIKLPKVGKKIDFNNETIDLGDFKLKLLSTERKDKDNVIISVDTGYDYNKIESLSDIQLYGNKKNDYDSWAGEYYSVSDKNPNLILKQWTIKLNHPNSSDFTLTIESFDTIKKGPWIIDIPGNATKK